MWNGILAGNLILLSIMLLCWVTCCASASRNWSLAMFCGCLNTVNTPTNKHTANKINVHWLFLFFSFFFFILYSFILYLFSWKMSWAHLCFFVIQLKKIINSTVVHSISQQLLELVLCFNNLFFIAIGFNLTCFHWIREKRRKKMEKKFLIDFLSHAFLDWPEVFYSRSVSKEPSVSLQTRKRHQGKHCRGMRGTGQWRLIFL